MGAFKFHSHPAIQREEKEGARVLVDLVNLVAFSPIDSLDPACDGQPDQASRLYGRRRLNGRPIGFDLVQSRFNRQVYGERIKVSQGIHWGETVTCLDQYLVGDESGRDLQIPGFIVTQLARPHDSQRQTSLFKLGFT